jgi:hypothetical protein
MPSPYLGHGLGSCLSSPLAGKPFCVGRLLNPHASGLPLSGHVGLDKLIQRFNVQHTELTRVPLFNAAP